MKQDTAGRRATPKDSSTCRHGRLVVDDEIGEDNKRIGNLTCRECGPPIPDPCTQQ
jgi:hypothetical protein